MNQGLTTVILKGPLLTAEWVAASFGRSGDERYPSPAVSLERR